jgi:hypothetical protein
MNLDTLTRLAGEAPDSPWTCDFKAHREFSYDGETAYWTCLVRRPTQAKEAVAAAYGWEWRGEGAADAIAAASYIAATSPHDVMKLIRVARAAQLLMYMHEQLGPHFIPHDEIELRECLRALEKDG